MTRKPNRFTCTDCGYKVATFSEPQFKNVCAVCSYLRTITDPVDREEMRRHLQPKEE